MQTLEFINLTRLVWTTLPLNVAYDCESFVEGGQFIMLSPFRK